MVLILSLSFFFQAEDGIRDFHVTGVQTCALPILEEVLSNKAYERFNKNVNVKRGNLSSYIVTEKSDVDFLLAMYSKYSVPIHDGGVYTIPALPERVEIGQDIQEYVTWRTGFGLKLKAFKDANNYN